jgi:hypothetical protein
MVVQNNDVTPVFVSVCRVSGWNLAFSA